MKFVHIADVHFDKPFTLLEQNGLSERRRLEQREAFHNVITHCKENKVDALLIAGDLYEHEYVRKSSIEFINQCFQEIEETTRVFIAPGNHDPYLTNSYYHHFGWNSNVKIFDRLEKVELDGANIYGYGFTDFYNPPMALPQHLDSTKENILVMHADVNGAKDGENHYNPILETALRESEFAYIALGHIHKNNLSERTKWVYPGSLVAGGFDELGKHGMVVGEVDEAMQKVTLTFQPVDCKEFLVKQVDVSTMNSEEEVIEAINNIQWDVPGYYKVELVGVKQTEINTNTILKNVNYSEVLKIKDKTSIAYNIEALAREKTLKGIFVQELLQQIKEDKTNEEEIMKLIELGLQAM